MWKWELGWGNFNSICSCMIHHFWVSKCTQDSRWFRRLQSTNNKHHVEGHYFFSTVVSQHKPNIKTLAHSHILSNFSHFLMVLGLFTLLHNIFSLLFLYFVSVSASKSTVKFWNSTSVHAIRDSSWF
jgi:hypothetical protein